MERRSWREVTAAAVAVPALLGLGLAMPASAVDYGEYHTYAEVESQLEAWEQEHRERLSLTAYGESAGGRALYVAQVSGDGPVPADERPAVFVGANMAGYHNAGTEAALELLETLLTAGDGPTAELLGTTTFYVVPVLNPDAHDGLFAPVRQRRAGADGRLDRDRDGLAAEDGADDLDADGAITQLRIPDPAGGWLPHPQEARLMVRADPAKGWAGAYRLLSEGSDDDGDGRYNEDGPAGVQPDRNFAHAYPYHEPEAGPWPSYAPESRAIMDFLLARRNVALAVVYGPANNFLALPQSLGGGGDLGTQKFTLPEDIAEFLGLDPEQEYTLDEVWEVAKDLPFVRRNNITKDQAAQLLGAGPATKLEDEDQALLSRLAKGYKERLEEVGLDAERPGEQYRRGGFTPWLYYQYGALAVELDVWGVPTPEKGEKEGGEGGEALTLDRLAEMSSEEFLELSVETVAAFLKEIGAPPQFTAEALMDRVRSGQVTPGQMAQMARQMGAGGGGGGEGEDDAATKRRRQVLAWVDEHAPEASHPWSAVALPDGTAAEAGGLDPFIEIAPPREILAPALAVHTETVLDLAGKLARVEILSLEAEPQGGGVYRVEAVAGNRGALPTHTKMAQRAQARLPLRLKLAPGAGVELITGHPAVAHERLEAGTGTFEGAWLVRGEDGATVTVHLGSDNAGDDSQTLTLGKGAPR